MADIQPGDLLIDRFEVLGTLGRGGMATVYLVDDRAREERVAVKVLHGHLAHDPTMRRRLRREVVAAGLVRHEAALAAYDLHDLGSTLALSMPFHAGTTLTERVRAGGPLTEGEVRRIGIRIASALADAHRRGVLHRDVTPNNVMLSEADDAVLTDFGLARMQEGTATATSVMGTPGYAAPEVYAGQRTDPRSDLYSLGALLYFAASGRSPFGVGAPAAILQAQLTGEPESLAALCPHLSTELVQTIEALLQNRPERRPPSAQEIALALEAGRQALVPEVPDTWNPAEDGPLPAGREVEAIALQPIELPHGDWEVEVKGRKGNDARRLADEVGRVLELPAGSLEVTKPMRTRKGTFMLTRGTDRETARRLAEGAKLAGYRARPVDTSEATLFQAVMGAAPILIPVVWVAFPFVTTPLMGGSAALFFSIAATVIIPALTQPFAKRRPASDLPVALPGDPGQYVIQPGQEPQDDLDAFIDGLGLPGFLRDIAHEMASDGDLRSVAQTIRRGVAGASATTTKPATAPRQPEVQPAASPASEPTPKPVSRAEDLRGRALGNLDLLAATVADLADLPDAARADLTRTTRDLRSRTEELARIAGGVEAALASTPEAPDTSWIHGRLTRLETLDRAGDAVDREELARLKAALVSADAASDAREQLESRLTSSLAQLLEIAGVAARTRAELLAQGRVPDTASDLAAALDRQVKAVDATRRELDQRQQRRPLSERN